MFECDCKPHLDLQNLYCIDITSGPLEVPDLGPETPETQEVDKAVEKASAALMPHWKNWQNRPSHAEVLQLAGVTEEQWQKAFQETLALAREHGARKERLECETLQDLAIAEISAIHLPAFEGRRSHCIVEWDDGIIDRVIQHMESAGFVVARHSKIRRRRMNQS